MAHKKRRNRLGHVTRNEEIKAEDSVTAGVNHCRAAFKGEKLTACIDGALSVHKALRKNGLIP